MRLNKLLGLSERLLRHTSLSKSAYIVSYCQNDRISCANLEDPPWDTTHSLTECKDRQRRREEGDKYCNGHPSHEEHHGMSTPKTILCPRIEQQACQLPNETGIAQTRLPCRRDEFCFRFLGIRCAETVLKLWLAVERRDLDGDRISKGGQLWNMGMLATGNSQ
jgi:hypothetical protein